MTLRLGVMLWATILVFPFDSAQAAEKGLIIRAGDLMAEPFVDAANASPVAASEPVTLLERRGGWVRVETSGGTGWVRMLNVRLEAGGATLAAAPATGRSNSLSLLRTGSSARTVTTGIKGLGEEDIRAASANYAQLDQLGNLAVGTSEARENAQKNQLKENKVAYLKNAREKGRGK
jgi:hypothetical protein